MTTKPVYWTSPVPEGDQATGQPFDGVMYDANIPGLGWGLYCEATFKQCGGRTGMGLGQRYEKQTDGRWLKTEG